MYYYVLPDGSIITAKTQEELKAKIKEWREGNS